MPTDSSTSYETFLFDLQLKPMFNKFAVFKSRIHGLTAIYYL